MYIIPFAKLDEHDKKFDRVFAKLEEHDRKFDEILTILKSQAATLESLSSRLDSER